jgi:hypothetical protein
MNEDSGVVEAELQVGQARIRYLRAGEGPVVLLLRASRGGPGDDLGDTFHLLTAEHRVVAPVEPPPGRRAEAERWLRDVVEGLGLRSPEVLADAALAPLLSRFVRRNVGLVGRVVFLPAGDEVRAKAGEGSGGEARATAGPLPKGAPGR